MSTRIRLAKIEDIPDISNALHELWIELVNENKPVEGFVQKLEAGLWKCFIVAECDGNICGIIKYIKDKNIRYLPPDCEEEVVKTASYIGSFYVYKNYRSRGVGTALFKKAIELLENTDPIYLSAEDQEGLKFYSKFGFHSIGECMVCERYDNKLCKGKALLVCEP